MIITFLSFLDFYLSGYSPLFRVVLFIFVPGLHFLYILVVILQATSDPSPNTPSHLPRINLHSLTHTRHSLSLRPNNVPYMETDLR